MRLKFLSCIALLIYKYQISSEMEILWTQGNHPLYEYTRLDFIEPVFYEVMVNATLLTPTDTMTKYGDTFKDITLYLTPAALKRRFLQARKSSTILIYQTLFYWICSRSKLLIMLMKNMQIFGLRYTVLCRYQTTSILCAVTPCIFTKEEIDTHCHNLNSQPSCGNEFKRRHNETRR